MRFTILIALLALIACVESPEPGTIEFEPGPGAHHPPESDAPGRLPERPDDHAPMPDDAPDDEMPSDFVPPDRPCDAEWRIDTFNAYRVDGLIHFEVIGQRCAGAVEEHPNLRYVDQNGRRVIGRCTRYAFEQLTAEGHFRTVDIVGGCSGTDTAERVHLRTGMETPDLAVTDVAAPQVVGLGEACEAATGRICAAEHQCGPDRTCRMAQPPQLDDVGAELSLRTGAFGISATFTDINGDYGGFQVHFRDADGALLGEMSATASGWSLDTVTQTLSASGRLAPQIDPARIATFDVYGVDTRGLLSEPISVQPAALPELERGASCTNLQGQCAPGLVCNNQSQQCDDATACDARALPRTRSLEGQPFAGEADDIEFWAVDLTPGVWRVTARVRGAERPEVPMSIAAVASCDPFAFQHMWMMFVGSYEGQFRLNVPETVYFRVTGHHGADEFDLIVEPAE
jgi:hypothetical protein